MRLHRIIERIPKTQRYRLTDFGLKVALFYSRLHQRFIRPGLSELCDPNATTTPTSLAHAFAAFRRALNAFAEEKLAA